MRIEDLKRLYRQAREQQVDTLKAFDEMQRIAARLSTFDQRVVLTLAGDFKRQWKARELEAMRVHMASYPFAWLTRSPSYGRRTIHEPKHGGKARCGVTIIGPGRTVGDFEYGERPPYYHRFCLKCYPAESPPEVDETLEDDGQGGLFIELEQLEASPFASRDDD